MDDDKLENYMNMIIKGGNRASKLVDEMLVFSRSETDATQLVYVNDVVMDTVSFLNLETSVDRLRYYLCI